MVGCGSGWVVVVGSGFEMVSVEKRVSPLTLRSAPGSVEMTTSLGLASFGGSSFLSLIMTSMRSCMALPGRCWTSSRSVMGARMPSSGWVVISSTTSGSWDCRADCREYSRELRLRVVVSGLGRLRLAIWRP